MSMGFDQESLRQSEDIAIGSEVKWRPNLSAGATQGPGRSMPTKQRYDIPKTQPERVQLLTYDPRAARPAAPDGTDKGCDGWVTFLTRIQLGKKMFSWGEKRGTLLAEEMERTELDGLPKVSTLQSSVDCACCVRRPRELLRAAQIAQT